MKLAVADAVEDILIAEDETVLSVNERKILKEAIQKVIENIQARTEEDRELLSACMYEVQDTCSNFYAEDFM